MGLELDGVNGIIKNTTSDGDITIKGNDGGSEISLLTFDVSAEGAATFNSTITSTASTTITVADNSDNLTLVSTDADGNSGPNLRLYRNNDSNGDGDVLGQIDFEGRNDNSQDVVYARIRAVAEDITDGTEDARLIIEKAVNGSTTEIMRSVGSETVFNDGSIDLDFRVESNGNTHMLFVDGGNDHVNIGTSTDHGGKFNIETTDNTFNLTLVSTDADANSGPNMKLYRNSGSPADSDIMGNVYFTGRNDNSQDVAYAHIETLATDVSDGAEDGYMNIYVAHAGTEQRSRIEMDSTETVFNEGSADLDFRVESNGKANMLFVDGGNNRVNIGSSTDVAATLVVSDGDSGQNSPAANANTFVIEKNDNCGLSILASTNAYSSIHFGDSGDTNIGQIFYDHSADTMQFHANATQIFTIHSSGVVFNEASNDQNFRIESNSYANAFFVDANENAVFVGTTSFYDTNAILTARSGSGSNAIVHFSNNSGSYDGNGFRIAFDTDESTSNNFVAYTDTNDTKFKVRGDGVIFADGGNTINSADFAEYFESTDGSVIAIGKTVVLDNGKVRASTNSDNAADIVGVVRHRKTAGIVGNDAWGRWKGKYKLDDYGVPLLEEYTITEWDEIVAEDADDLEVTYKGEKRKLPQVKGDTINHSYATDKIPSELTVPSDAKVLTVDADGNKYKRKIFSDSYDASKTYVSREFRDEWNLIGLIGQVTMTKGQKTGDRWIKMRDISDTVEEWLVR